MVGTYVWTWGAVDLKDSLTLNIIKPVAVPEPATLASAGMGVFLSLTCA